MYYKALYLSSRKYPKVYSVEVLVAIPRKHSLKCGEYNARFVLLPYIYVS